ncbi:class I SAM-dependent methyltransferase [Natroniella acetigena]|uniref:class I SAM-dependent methyltransferase n=1 Tax=Natroniella acetigena TaxID=52004 RepID=UPI00200B60C3|nr:class I SAM-dependent methyltransferase [Natroniella acetigena]MCK8827288.1 class I SAM-dependent methyltransferase [Natroniella acetigena]
MFKWNKKKLEWFKAASAETDFYCGVIEKCQQVINQEDTFIELGCGLGELSLSLISQFKSGTALDINREVIDYLRNKCSGLEVDNLELIVGDWLTFNFFTGYDVVLLSYLNGISSNLERLFSLSKKYIIVVLPQKAENNPFHLNEFYKIEKKGRETVEKAVDDLVSQNIDFELIEQTAEFGQPLKSFRDYKDFLRVYFGIEEEAIINKLAVKYLQETEEGYYLPNRKKSGIIIIETNKGLKK